MTDPAEFFRKAAAIRQQLPHGCWMTQVTSDINMPEDGDDSYTSSVKMAASMHDFVRALRALTSNHLFNASLYAPLVAADLSEARTRRREGKSSVLPALAGSALAVMMAQHLAPELNRFIRRDSVQKILTQLGVGKK